MWFLLCFWFKGFDFDSLFFFIKKVLCNCMILLQLFITFIVTHSTHFIIHLVKAILNATNPESSFILIDAYLTTDKLYYHFWHTSNNSSSMHLSLAGWTNGLILNIKNF